MGSGGSGAGCSVPGARQRLLPSTQRQDGPIYWQLAATIFTDDTSSVRALLVPDVAAGRLADGSVVAPAAPAAPVVLVAPDALLDAALPVTVMRWPTCAARSPPRSIQVADGPADAEALAPDEEAPAAALGPPAAPAPDGLGVEVAAPGAAPLPLDVVALACWTLVNVKPPSAPFCRQPVRFISPVHAITPRWRNG